MEPTETLHNDKSWVKLFVGSADKAIKLMVTTYTLYKSKPYLNSPINPIEINA